MNQRNQPSRRDWLQAAGAFASSGLLSATLTRAGRTVPHPHSVQLSTRGCGRATGYAEANKIVTLDGRTHTTWLDSERDGFYVRIRTLNRSTGQWSPAYTVGGAHDNHGGPALTIDGEGYLHIVYYPHHHPMRYRKSKRPNDASQWEEEISFGQHLTYPTLVCGKDNALYMSARRRYSDRPFQVELWKKMPGAPWQSQGPILAARYRGYAHFQESLAWGPDHETLHLACRFHENSDKEAYGRLQTVAYLKSTDAGKTWQQSNGQPVTTPATADTAEVLARGGLDHNRVLRAGPVAVNSEGEPHILFSVEENEQSQFWINRRSGRSLWQEFELSPVVPEPWKSWKLKAPAGMTFNQQGDLIVIAAMARLDAGESGWGHVSSELVALRHPASAPVSTGGFSFDLVSEPDGEVAHWLPSIERPTGHHPVTDPVGVLYTAGGPGSDLQEKLSNGVLFRGV